MLFRVQILLLLMFGLSACVASQPRPQPLSSQSQRIQLEWFSVATPSESGWYVAQRDNQSVQLAKRGGATDETYAIQAWVSKLPKFDNDKAFSSYAAQFTGNSSNRFMKKKSRVKKVKTKHGVCMRFTSIHQDNSAVKRSNNPKPMFLEVEGIICQNSKTKSQGANLVFSNRYYEGNRDKSLSKKANSLFGSLKFAKL